MVRFNMKHIGLLSILFFILLFLRRGMQFLSPQIWNEDGPFNMTSFILSGWSNLIEPTQGYLILIPKLITDISMSISFIYYPEISTYLTWIITILIALLVVYAPTKLKYKVLSACAIFLIPTNAEVYGLPLYMLWFASIILFIVALWEEGKQPLLRVFLLILGGLSTPVIVVLIPVQLFRLVTMKQKKWEIAVLALSIVISIVQLYFISHHGAGKGLHVDLKFFETVIDKFFAYYYLNFFEVNRILLLLGALYLIGLIFVYFLQNRHDYYFLILIYLLTASIALSAVRMDPGILTPIFGGGARYFFLPYILLSWTLIYMMAKNKWYETAILPVLVLALITALQGFCRTHDDLQWRKHIDLCQRSEGKYAIPIENDGKSQYAWHLVLDAKTCKKYIENDMFELPEMRGK